MSDRDLYLKIAEDALAEVERKVGEVKLKAFRAGKAGSGFFAHRLPSGQVEMRVPRPTTLYNLEVFLHECGHVLLGHIDRDDYFETYASTEYNAEAWALNRLERKGLLTDNIVKQAKKHVAKAIRLDRKRGNVTDSRVLRFAEGYI